MLDGTDRHGTSIACTSDMTKTRVHLGRAAALLLIAPGCYLFHTPDAGDTPEVPAPDAAPQADAAAPMDGSPSPPLVDAAPPDPGPERAMRWERLASELPAPPARLAHLAVYDDVDDRMIVLGGYDPYLDVGACCVDPYVMRQDIWTLDLETQTWTLVAELPTPLLALHPVALALDRPRGRLVVVGAVDEPNFGRARNLTIDLSTWEVSELPSGPWPAREWPLRASHDPARHRIVVHETMFELVRHGVYVFDLATDEWLTDSVGGGEPGVRYHTPLVHSRDAAYLYAGYGPDEPPDRIWRLNAGDLSWTSTMLTGDVEEGRWSHRAVHEPLRELFVVFGGMRNSAHLATLLIELPTGLARAPVFDTIDPIPQGRRDHSMVLDARRRRALVFGGAHGSEVALSDTWALTLP